jgi:hypothetical protein
MWRVEMYEKSRWAYVRNRLIPLEYTFAQRYCSLYSHPYGSRIQHRTILLEGRLSWKRLGCPRKRPCQTIHQYRKCILFVIQNATHSALRNVQLNETGRAGWILPRHAVRFHNTVKKYILCDRLVWCITNRIDFMQFTWSLFCKLQVARCFSCVILQPRHNEKLLNCCSPNIILINSKGMKLTKYVSLKMQNFCWSNCRGTKTLGT